ncbi:sugar ABC transporter substrate-binding protein [Terrarubrum flagellatum]|uniref:ABC transporter substrate-binding protein n=1 Tax=Terrirubrum flagellatum TaxID=2895980 RepID=UPI0031456D33
MSRIDRRQFSSYGAATLGLAASVGGAQAQSGTRLRCFWWGNPERDKRTRAALDAYEKKAAGVQVTSESIGWGEYWTKLATQTAGGNAPDLIQMDYRYIYEYARRNTLLALEGVMPKPLDLATFSPGARDSGKVDGKLYGVTLGVNSKAMIYDVAMFEKVGVKKLDLTWTWDDMARIAGEISKLNPGKYWGTGDNSRWEQGFEHWLNQRGKFMYTEDGKANFSRDEVAEWFDLWDKLRKTGACAPAEVAAMNTGAVDQYEISRGTAAMSYANSNQIVAFQSISKSKLAMSSFPSTPGKPSGHYIKPSMLMSVSSRSKSQEEAAKIIQFMVNEDAGVKALGIERGVPGSSEAQKMIASDLDDLGKAQVDYVAAITKVAVPLPPPPPKGAGEIETLLRRVADSVAFGKQDVKAGAAQFHMEAVNVLARA